MGSRGTSILQSVKQGWLGGWDPATGPFISRWAPRPRNEPRASPSWRGWIPAHCPSFIPSSLGVALPSGLFPSLTLKVPSQQAGCLSQPQGGERRVPVQPRSAAAQRSCLDKAHSSFSSSDSITLASQLLLLLQPRLASHLLDS